MWSVSLVSSNKSITCVLKIPAQKWASKSVTNWCFKREKDIMQNYKLAKEVKAVQKQEGCDLQLT